MSKFERCVIATRESPLAMWQALHIQSVLRQRYPEADVELECRNVLMKYIIDRFGEKIKVRPTENGTFLTTVTVQLSPVFYGWVFQFGGGIKITNPKFVKMNYEELLNKAIGK